MQEEDFKEMRKRFKEIEDGIIYLDNGTGFYNFQKLEGLLRRHDLLIEEHEELFERLRKHAGLPSDEEVIDRIAEHDALDMEFRSRRVYSPEEHYALKERLKPDIMVFRYEDVGDWYKWTMQLDSLKNPGVIELDGRWNLEYLKDFQGLRISKTSNNATINCLGPMFNYFSGRRPYFELQIKCPDSSGAVESHSSYDDVKIDVLQKCFEFMPPESEIEEAVNSFCFVQRRKPGMHQII